MESPLRGNGSNNRPTLQAPTRAAARSRVAGRVERVLTTAIGGERAAVLNVTAAELLGESVPVARALESALDRPGVGVLGHMMVHDLIRRSKLYDELVNALSNPNPVTRASAARICAAARLPDSVLWLGDLLQDSNPRLRDAGVRSLARLGGRRAVDLLMGAGGRTPQYRLPTAPPNTAAAPAAPVLACGIRGDGLRVPPLPGIAHDRRWPKQVRKAACKS